MNNLSKKYVNEQGVEETIIANSDDNYELTLGKNYTLSNHQTKKENRLTKKFKGSILGADIGIKSNGFSSIAILAGVIALAAALIMYFIWKF